MKTDDDSFVRVDEVLASLKRTKVTHGLLYGLINSDARPHRSSDSKWYISPEVVLTPVQLLISHYWIKKYKKTTRLNENKILQMY